MIGYSMLFTLIMVIAAVLPVTVEAQQDEVHPVILYTAGEADAIHERLDREPYAGWLNRIQTIADDAIALSIAWSGTDVPKQTQAYYAKLMATAYVFSAGDDPRRASWADEAAESLYGIPSGNYKGKFRSDLELSQAAASWAAAYDMLAGAGYDFMVNDASLEDDIRNKLNDLRDYMARSWDESLLGYHPSMGWDWTSCAWTSAARTDNHHVKRFAALAMVSLAVYDRGGSPDDLARARQRLMDSLDNMIVNGAENESVWAEGPDYHHYSMNEYIPALIAMKNAGYYDYTQLADLAQAHLSLPRMAMPDSYLPPFDDNGAGLPYMAGLLYAIHPGLLGRDTLDWLWESAGSPMNTIFLPEYLTRYDDSPPAAADPGDVGWDVFGVYPESGFARFRSSWDADAVYLLLQGEHGEARAAGQAHEHPDPGSFMLHAYGDLLITDSGYGGWADHDQTRHAASHNIILVNGEGPTSASQSGGISNYWNANGSDAYITGNFSTTAMDYAVSQTEYRNAAFSRHVLFPGRRYVLLYDAIESGAGNTYTLLLHGYGGGDTDGTFVLRDSGASWERGNAGVASVTVGTGELSFAAQEYSHAVYRQSTMGSHTALEVSQEGRDAGYLTLLYPYPIGAAPPAVTEISGDRATGVNIDWGDSTDYCIIAVGEAPRECIAGNRTITTDADLVWLGERDGSFSAVTMLNGTSLMDGDSALITASGTVSISLSHVGGNAVEGYVSAGFDTRITIPVDDAVEVTVNGLHTYHETADGATTFWATGEGYWRMERSGQTGIEPPADFRAADVPDDHGHQMDLFWSPSPSEAGGLVSQYRIYRSRVSEFGEVRAIDSFADLDELIAWEETNTVLVDSVAAGVTTYRDSMVPLTGRYYYFLQAVGSIGVSEKVLSNDTITGVTDTAPEPLILATSPNPFNAAVTISYALPSPTTVRLRIVTIAGQEAAVADEGFRAAGGHAVIWDSAGMPSGAYICVLEAGDMRLTSKMLLLK